MANSDAPLGFRLIASGGRQPRRVRRLMDGASAVCAPGDAYLVANAVASRATARGGVSGIIESLEVAPLVEGGPVSKAITTLNGVEAIIGIEDADAEFEVQIATAAITDFDSGALVDIIATAPDTTLNQSREEVALAGVDMKLVRLVDRPDNAYGAHAKVVVKLLAASVI